jgi:hypothetical protein
MKDVPESQLREAQAYPKPHAGMPPLKDNQPPISFFEFWPTKLFYAPVTLHWIYLSLRFGSTTLPTAANPSFPLGGLVGESKAIILGSAEGVAKERISPFVSVFKPSFKDSSASTLTEACARMAEANLSFPVVAKPDMGCRGAGVKVARNKEDLGKYIESYPQGGRIVIQKLVPYEPEAGVFYIRRPGATKGQIFSLTLKYFPHIVGDGTSTIEQLILQDPRASKVPHLYLGRHKEKLQNVLAEGAPYRLAFAGSHSRGAIFRNGNEYITDEMCEAFDRIADGLPGFCFGRFDLRFPNIKELQKGGEFRVLEINGAGGEATHIWDSKTTLREAYRTLREQFRTLFEIGAENRRLGHRPATLREVYRAYRLEGQLTAEYPQTD